MVMEKVAYGLRELGERTAVLSDSNPNKSVITFSDHSLSR